MIKFKSRNYPQFLGLASLSSVTGVDVQTIQNWMYREFFKNNTYVKGKRLRRKFGLKECVKFLYMGEGINRIRQPSTTHKEADYLLEKIFEEGQELNHGDVFVVTSYGMGIHNLDGLMEISDCKVVMCAVVFPVHLRISQLLKQLCN